MSGLWEKIKTHPYIAIAVVLGVFILVYLLVGGSSAPAQSGGGNNNYAAEVAAATQLQESQLQNQTNMAGINAQTSVQMANTQAAVTIAQLQANNVAANINTQQTVALANIQANQETQDLQTTTYGQIASNQIAAQEAVANATIASNVTNATTAANMNEYLANIAGNAAMFNGVIAETMQANKLAGGIETFQVPFYMSGTSGSNTPGQFTTVDQGGAVTQYLLLGQEFGGTGNVSGAFQSPYSQFYNAPGGANTPGLWTPPIPQPSLTAH
jgi:hypothetical protein